MKSQNKFISLIVVVMVAKSVSSRAAPPAEPPNTHTELMVWTPPGSQSTDEAKDSVPPPPVSQSNCQDSLVPSPESSNGQASASPLAVAESSSQKGSVSPPADSQNEIIATLQVPVPIADEIKNFLASMQDSEPTTQDAQSTMQNPQSATLYSQPAMQNLVPEDGRTPTDFITSTPVLQPFRSKKDLEQFHFEQWTKYDLTLKISEVDFEVQIQSHFEGLPDEHLHMLCSKVGVLFDMTIVDHKKVDFDKVTYESFDYNDKTLKIKTMTCNCEKTNENGKELVTFHMGDSFYDETSAFIYFANEKGELRPEAYVNALPLLR